MRIKLSELTPLRIYEAVKRRVEYVPHAISWNFTDLGHRNKATLKGFENKYAGKRCFIVANGPSLKHIDMPSLKDEITFTMNRSYLLHDDWGFKPTFHVCINELVLEQFCADLDVIQSQKFYNWNRRHIFRQQESTNFLNITLDFTDRFSVDPSKSISSGGTVTFACLQLAYYLGFSEVIIVGMDHSFVEKGRANKTEVREQEVDESHCHPDYFPKGSKWQLPDLLRSEMAYALARSRFEADGRQIYDATVNGKCTVFKKRDFNEFFEN